MPDPIEHLKMIIRTSFEELDRVIDETEAFFSRFTDDEDLVQKIMLLTTEAVTNAIEHGNALDETKSVILEFVCGVKLLEVWVEDEGEGFDRSAVPDPLSPDGILQDGGRGIFLIEELADEVHYGNDGRRIGMKFGRQARPS